MQVNTLQFSLFKEIWDKYPQVYIKHQNSIFFDEDTVKMVVDYMNDNLILGGDVWEFTLEKGIEPTYLNWHYDGSDLDESKIKAKDFLYNSYIKGKGYLFTLVINV